jgi:hypothetical protein
MAAFATQVMTNFSDYRVDMLSISSYSDAGGTGSLLAHGIVDNLILTVPDPPVGVIYASFSNQTWQASFAAQTNWLYALERTADFKTWSDASDRVNGTGGLLAITATNSQPVSFYRVRAEKP